ncbi:hypothetical protein O181_040901 [Austropuccinia psidii MF-1]|uniref:Uncharacterized protein n=1 Tax=Austropuccinia psidii MF-1 TaxID=1389203 RepID=A0A9Q3DIQ5_9BASI|nr:hypothetical protein [Austropuccinia psidii MF-1]
MSQPLALCTCETCISNVFTEADGTTIHGKLLTQRSKRRHHQRRLSSLDCNGSSLSNPPSRDPTSHANKVEDDDETSTSSSFDTSDSSHNEINSTPLLCMITIFITWLHLFCNLSKERCQRARNFLLRILEQRRKNENCPLALPQDPRTLIKVAVPSFDLRRIPYCPTCYCLYSTNHLPSNCTYRETPQCNPCNTPLFTQ